MKRTTIRCSSLPAAFVCPGSIRRGEVEIDPVSEPAGQGSAGHDVMRAIVDMGARGLDDIDLGAIAARFGADAEELRIQAFVGLRLWRTIENWFPDAQAEVELRADIKVADDHVVELVGHVDALSVLRARRKARHADWKFGRVDKTYGHQVKGYGSLILSNYEEVDTADGYVFWMREERAEPHALDRDGMWAWVEQLASVVVEWDGVYHPGPQCAHCRRSHDCPARTEMARRDVEAIAGPEMRARIETGLRDLPDAEVVGLDRRARFLQKILEDLREAVRLRVIEAGGRLRDGEGRELRIKETARRRYDPELAKPVLDRWLKPEELLAATVYVPTKVDKAISDKTKRGEKAKALEKFEEELRAADALREDKHERLEDVRTQEDDE